MSRFENIRFTCRIPAYSSILGITFLVRIYMSCIQHQKMPFAILFTLALLGCKSPDAAESTASKVVEPTQVKTASEVVKPSRSEIDSWVKQHVLIPEKLAEHLTDDSKPVEYIYNSVDLNNDGQAETLVVIQDIYFCGSGGCTAYLFDAQGHILNKMTLIDDPIFVAREKNHGWHNIIVRSRDAYHVMAYDGQKYPLNPSMQPKVKRAVDTAKKLLIQTDLYQQDGYNLVTESPTEILAPFQEYMYRFEHYGEPDIYYQATVDLHDKHVDIEKKYKNQD